MKFLSNLGIGVCYLLICVPDIRRCKIGVTGMHIGAGERAKQVSDSLPGWLIPVFGCILPGYVFFEKRVMHWGLKPLNAPFKKGSGHTEIFWFPAPIYAVALMCGVWMIEAWAVLWAWDFIATIFHS
jgi:hypothetical protein